MFQECFKKVSKVIRGRLRSVPRDIYVEFKEASRGSKRSSFQGSFKGVKEVSRV